MRRAAAIVLGLALLAPHVADAQPLARPGAGRAHAGGRGTEAPRAARPTIVFLHGLGSAPDNGVFQRVRAELATHGTEVEMTSPWLRPVALDAKGRYRDAGPHTMTDQLARARAALAPVQGPVVLVGHSFGGKAALALARELPGKVKGIVGLAPSLNMLYSYWKGLTGDRGLPAPAVLGPRLAQHRRALEGKLARVPSSSREARHLAGELGYLHVMQDLVAHDEAALERGLKTPMLLVHGTDDEAVSIHYARRFAAENPGVELIEYPGLGHGFDKPHPVLPNRLDEQATRAAARDMAARINDFVLTHAR